MTLRKLANDERNPLTLQEWIAFTTKIGLTLDPDTELDQNAALQIRSHWQELKKLLDQKPTQNQQSNSEDDAKKKEAAAVRLMDKLIRDNYVFVDFSSLVAPMAAKTFEALLPFLEKYRKKLNVTKSAINKMSALSQKDPNSEEGRLCGERVTTLLRLKEQGYALIRSNGNDANSAHDMYTCCSHFRLQGSLLVITQDEKLALDLISLNKQRSTAGKPIIVKRVNKYGYLSPVFDPPKKPFRLFSAVRTEKDSVMAVSELPKQNDVVYVSANAVSMDVNNAILLKEELGSGGEGTIYRTNVSGVAKIYNPDCCTAYRLEKLQKMIEAKLSYEGICFPSTVLYNRYGQFVGYLMREAKGYSIQSSIFRKPLFMKKLPHWTKADLVQCAITILYKIKYLHDNNILIGDINPNNFLVVSPQEVYLVDTDSFQINDLPCPVGFPLFTAPEIHQLHRQGKFSDYSEIMRTRKNEYFAVATLMFMLMLPGKPPYTQQGGEDIVDNILEMHFPYALGERRGENVPDGTWRFIWSHLTRRMKENFHRVFDHDDEKSEFNADERLSVDQWIIEMQEYRRILEMWRKELDENPQNGDAQSLLLYPTALKRLRGVEYVKCRGAGCENEYPKDDPRMKAGFCPECQRKGEDAVCLYCGNHFTFTNYEKYYRKFDKPLLCPECRKKKDQIAYSANCVTPGCFNKVEVSIGQMAYFKSKGWEMPKKCQFCRDNLKNRNHNSSRYVSTHSPEPEKPRKPEDSFSYDPPKRSDTSESASPFKRPHSGKKGCFITTAVCDYLGKSDNCAEMMDFRWFRDNWLSGQPGGEDLILEYYACAPELVRQLEESPAYGEICQTLWDDYLLPCQKMIREGNFEACRAHYIAMADYLSFVLQLERV